MSLSLCVLSSSSKGNCTYVGHEEGGVLIDAGLSAKATQTGLITCGLSHDSVNAICLTHDHSDHHAGIPVLHKRYGYSLYGNAGTVGFLSRKPKYRELDWNIFTTGSRFEVAGMQIEPFAVPHDAYEPVGFVIEFEGVRVGIATDMGMVTQLIQERLKECDCVVVEANHDPVLVQEAQRPWSLKQRILGRQGHLSNDDAAELLAELSKGRVRHALLAHLSSDCNDAGLALRTVQRGLTDCGVTTIDLAVCPAGGPSPMWNSATRTFNAFDTVI